MKDALKVLIPVYGAIFVWRLGNEPTGGHAYGYDGILVAIPFWLNIAMTVALVWATIKLFF